MAAFAARNLPVVRSRATELWQQDGGHWRRKQRSNKKKHTPTHYFTRALSFNFSPLLPVLRKARKPKWLPLLENLIILHCLPRFPCYARTHRSCAKRKFLDVKMACIKLPELNEMRMYTHRGWPEKRKRTLCPARLQFPNLARKCSFR